VRIAHAEAQKSSIVGWLADTTYGVQHRRVRSNMSAVIVLASGLPTRTRDPLARLSSHLRAKFFRFLEQLPERHDDVDLEVFKRVPAPI
jgi:hypothetical protein